VRQGLRNNDVTPVIAWNGGTSKVRDFDGQGLLETLGDRTIFSRLKEMFGFSNNRFVGIGKVTIHAFSCLIAYLIKYVK